MRPANGRSAGFTLTEILLVVTLLAILTTLALPSYRHFLQRAQRTGAIAQLLEAAACQERLRATRGGYDTSSCLPTASEHYVFGYQPHAAPDGAYFELGALPVNAQSGDACGRLSIDSLGARGAGAPGADAIRCWAAR